MDTIIWLHLKIFSNIIYNDSLCEVTAQSTEILDKDTPSKAAAIPI